MTELLTKNEAAAALRLSLRTVDSLIAEGDIRVIRPGGRRAVRIEPAELRRFIDASKPTTDALDDLEEAILNACLASYEKRPRVVVDRCRRQLSDALETLRAEEGGELEEGETVPGAGHCAEDGAPGSKGSGAT